MPAGSQSPPGDAQRPGPPRDAHSAENAGRTDHPYGEVDGHISDIVHSASKQKLIVVAETHDKKGEQRDRSTSGQYCYVNGEVSASLDVTSQDMPDNTIEEARAVDKHASNDSQAMELTEVIKPQDLDRPDTLKATDPDRDTVDRLSVFSLYMEQDARYYFQHPYARIFVAYFVVFCNFLIYAEDPVAHSRKECTIPIIGNSFAFVLTYYPNNGWSSAKVFLWLIGILVGMLLGKFLIHKMLLRRLFRLKMFTDDQGSFMAMFITSIVCVFVMSWLYNALLMTDTAMSNYHISSLMGVKNSFFMKAAAFGTWLGDFFTAWMVTDIMLQEGKLYSSWASPVRKWWRTGYNRIILFWVTMGILTVLVMVVITTDIIQWDKLNRDFLPTNELSRAFLASFILIMDLLIVMQDWDFPHFINNFDIKLPGLNTAHIHFEIPNCLHKYKENWTVHITGKWFNYGIILLVMMLDLNMWKNQIFYSPFEYGQYADAEKRIYSVRDLDQLKTFNETQISYEWRSTNINNETNATYILSDVLMNSRYAGFALSIKAIAFVPTLIGFILFAVLIYMYGRYKPTEKDPYAGRLKKRRKKRKYTINTNRRSITQVTRGRNGKQQTSDNKAYPLNWNPGY